MSKPGLQDPKTGRFVSGNPGGPGRPKGSVDFIRTVRKYAERHGLELEAMVWAVARGLFVRAARGDAAAARLILERACGVLEKAGVEVNVGVDARVAREGPPVPETRDLGRYLGDLRDAAAKLLDVEIVDAEFTDPEVEELLA